MLLTHCQENMKHNTKCENCNATYHTNHDERPNMYLLTSFCPKCHETANCEYEEWYVEGELKENFVSPNQESML